MSRPGTDRTNISLSNELVEKLKVQYTSFLLTETGKIHILYGLVFEDWIESLLRATAHPPGKL